MKQHKFKRGDVCQDGMIFWGYKPSCRTGEWWVSPEKFVEYKETRTLKRRAEGFKERVVRTPSVTSPPPKYGDTHAEDGYRYQGLNKRNGRENWYSPAAWDRYLMRGVIKNARKRAAEHGWECNLTVEHLLSIYPKDGRCPLSKEPMVWGEADGRGNSPSIDRIDCAKGYLVGNVWFISTSENAKKAAYERDLPAWVKVYADDEGSVSIEHVHERPESLRLV